MQVYVIITVCIALGILLAIQSRPSLLFYPKELKGLPRAEKDRIILSIVANDRSLKVRKLLSDVLGFLALFGYLIWANTQFTTFWPMFLVGLPGVFFMREIFSQLFLFSTLCKQRAGRKLTTPPHADAT